MMGNASAAINTGDAEKPGAGGTTGEGIEQMSIATRKKVCEE